MRGYLGCVVGGLVLALGTTASAQVSLNTFGGYPAGIAVGSPYGSVAGGYGQIYMGVPNGPGTYRGAGTSFYNSGYSGYSSYYGGLPGTATFGTTVNYLAPTVGYYGGYNSLGYSPYSPSLGYGGVYPAYGSYYVPRSSFYGGGFLGRGRLFPW